MTEPQTSESATGLQLAIMRNVRFGVGDRGRCWLQFEARIGASCAALQILEVPAAVELIEAYGVTDVAKLDGRVIYVKVGGGTIIYSKPAVGL